jgi:hypothetical protein
MEEIKAPKKERKFLKGLGEIALVLIRELVLGIGKKVINKVGNKREKLVIAIIILSCAFAFAQYPATGNKQRLGYQTTGDGLVWRGRANDTVALKSSTINNSYVILDTVNNVMYVYIKTKGGWKFNNSDTVIINNNTDTTSLSSRINLKVNISDTASMLTNYLRSSVAASTYLTQSSAASTYLPLTGGILTGGLTGTTGTFKTLTINNNVSSGEGVLSINSNTFNDANRIQFGDVSGVRREILLPTGVSSLQFRTYPLGGTEGGYSFYTRRNPNAEQLAFNIDVDGNSNFYGTLGVTGATTLSNLAGSGTRMVTASSTGLLSTQTILTPTTRGSNTFTLPDIGAISFLRYNADNTVSQRAADGMRSDLGGTTIGQSMFTLTNPSAITFPRFNADNTVTALDAATFRTAIGAGTGNGNGTVTSVTGSLPISSSGGATPNITVANAGVSTTGVVTATTQTFGGDKTFNGVLNAISDLNVTGLSTLTGGATIGTMSTQSALTNILGVNSSNTIGEIGLNSVFSLSSGVLNIQDAGASQRGIVTVTTQSFGGNKTFTDIVGFSKSIQRPIATITGNTTIQTSNCWVIVNNTGGTTTLTLPDATLATGTELMIKTAQAQAVISASSNVVPLTFANTASTNILPATDGAWCTLVSNGTFWVTMQANF